MFPCDLEESSRVFSESGLSPRLKIEKVCLRQSGERARQSGGEGASEW
jgi:hypothetical protein